MRFLSDANSIAVHGADPVAVCDAANPITAFGVNNRITVYGEDNPITVRGVENSIAVKGADRFAVCGADSITCAARAIPSLPDSNSRRRRAAHLHHQPTKPSVRRRDQAVVLTLFSPVHSYHEKPASAPVLTRREPILTA
jgi:hypothetical protein